MPPKKTSDITIKLESAVIAKVEELTQRIEERLELLNVDQVKKELKTQLEIVRKSLQEIENGVDAVYQLVGIEKDYF